LGEEYIKSLQKAMQALFREQKDNKSLEREQNHIKRSIVERISDASS